MSEIKKARVHHITVGTLNGMGHIEVIELDKMNPDCRDEKHQSCSGSAWDEEKDELTGCLCPCHVEEHGGLVIHSTADVEQTAVTTAITDSMRQAMRNVVVWP